MADYDTMRERHRRDSMLTLSFLVFLLLIFGLDRDYINAVQNLVRNIDSLADVLEKSWVVLLITLVAPVISYVVGILTIARSDFYYDIDNIAFRRRKKVDRFICDAMLDFKIPLAQGDDANVRELRKQLHSEAKQRKVMSLFYRYIEQSDVVNPQLKSLAFVRWGDYFVSMMFVFWSAVALITAGAILILDRSLSVVRIGVIAVMLLLLGMNLVSILVGKIPRSQLEIPRTQIDEIHRNAAQSLLGDLKAEGFFLTNGRLS